MNTSLSTCQWNDTMTRRRSTRAPKWLPLWIVEVRWGWHPVKVVSRYCVRELTLARDLVGLPPPIKLLIVLGYEKGSPKNG